MKKQTVKLNLCKHAHENRFLMCWYTLIINGQTINFRSDGFVPDDVEDKLHDIHCKGPTVKAVIEKCKKLLLPYLDVICKGALEFLALPESKQRELQNSFDFDNKCYFENPLYNDYR